MNYGIERGKESEAAGRVGKGFPQVSGIIYCLCCKYLNQLMIFLQMLSTQIQACSKENNIFDSDGELTLE